MTKIYWYAPFNNAGELETAVELAKSPSIDLMVQSIAERFGRALDTASPGSVRLHRDLPAPSGEGTTRRSVVDRARTAIDRAVKRHRFVKANHFDLIHLHTYNPVTDWLAIPLLKRLSPIVIQSVHNVRPHDSVFPHRMETILLRQGYGACTAIFVAHPILKSMLVDEMGVFADRIHIVPFALTMPVVPPRTCDPDPPRPVRFLFFGTFRNNKGIEVLVEAIDLLESMSGSVGHDCEFVFAGRGEAALEQLVRECGGRNPRVTVEIGFVTSERRTRLYGDADCVLLPYTELKAQSGVLHDAYASRLPVIASGVGALGDAVRSHATGWVVPPNDVTALAEAILEVASSPQDRQAAAERAGTLAESHSTSSIAHLIEELYGRYLDRESAAR